MNVLTAHRHRFTKINLNKIVFFFLILANADFQYPYVLFHIIHFFLVKLSDFTMFVVMRTDTPLSVAYRAVPHAYQMLRSFPETALTIASFTLSKKLCLSTHSTFLIYI